MVFKHTWRPVFQWSSLWYWSLPGGCKRKGKTVSE